MHPETKAFLDMLAAQNGPTWQQMGPDAAREVFAGMTPLCGPSPEMAAIRDVEVEGRFRMRVFRPSDTPDLPALLYFHGGGWVLGDADTHSPLGRQIAEQSKCAVVLVDYRRAPEFPYPAAFDDCYDATVYVQRHASELELDPQRIAVGGDSAGGNLAMAVALKARDVAGPGLRGQLLIYPVVEPNFGSSSYDAFAEGFGLTRSSMQWFWEQYLGARHDNPDAYVVPTLAESFEGLPVTHVVTAEFDVLRDEGEKLAEQLQKAGVTATHRRYDGVIHGFVHFNNAFEVGRQAVADIAKWLEESMLKKSL